MKYVARAELRYPRRNRSFAELSSVKIALP